MKPTILAIAVSLALTNSVQAAQRIYIEQELPNLSKQEHIQANEKHFIQAFEQQHRGSSLQKMQSMTLESGKTLARFQQTYQGVPVWNSSLVQKKDKHQALPSLSGFIVANIGNDVKTTIPTLSPKQAANKALGGKTGEIQQVQLIIYQLPNAQAALAYLVTFLTQTQKVSRPFVVIHAHTGKELDRWEGITHAQATGPGGNEKTGRYNYGTDFPSLQVIKEGDTCKTISPNVRTYNLNNLTRGGRIHEFECPENTFKQINGAYSPINDAHAFGKVVFDMYKEWFNLAPLRQTLELRVHYGDNYENAFWDGQRMTFGDGAKRFYPLVSLDVVSHEVSHGFTEQNSNLVYRNQSGGINEAFSDIAGEAAESFFRGSNDWLVGAQIFKADGALRYFEDPTRDGRSIGHADDYRRGMDVHYSSGVFNRAFYLLSNTPGWGVRKAFNVFVTANRIYWSANSGFTEAGCGVVRAGQDYNYQTKDIIDAFATVGVDANCIGTPGDKVTVLNNGQVVSGLKGEEGEFLHYRIDVTEESDLLKVKTNGGWFSGDADLYVKFGEMPTEGSFDCNSMASNSNEVCEIEKPKIGSWFILIKGYSNFRGVSLEASF